jgi:hypothetical protein
MAHYPEVSGRVHDVGMTRTELTVVPPPETATDPIEAVPGPGFIAALMAQLSDLLAQFAPGTTVAFLLTRPGNGPISRIDRRWAVQIRACAADFGVPMEPFFRANDEALVQVPA